MNTVLALALNKFNTIEQVSMCHPVWFECSLPYEPQGKGLMETYLYQPSKSDLDLRLEDLTAGGSRAGVNLPDVAEGPEGESDRLSEDKIALPSSALMAPGGCWRHSETNSRCGGRRSFELNTGSSFVSQRCVKLIPNMDLAFILQN